MGYGDEQRAPGRDADLVLSPGEQALVQDGTKGHVSVYVGPFRSTISQTDNLVEWNPTKRRFEGCSQDRAITAFPTAPEGSYVVLDNPAPDGRHPGQGTSSANIDLEVGRRVNIPGPVSFALWPGQSASIIEGHRLRTNEYLIVRVINDEQARENWGSGVVRLQTTETSVSESKGVKDERSEGSDIERSTEDEDGIKNPPLVEDSAVLLSKDVPEELVMGQLIMVPGTEVSFFIPPTGVEVVPDNNGKYVRQAVTLERLEYCILLDESGDKRYVRGPAVVFPTPTETFVEKEGGMIKFRAVELNNIQGVYIKVNANYHDADLNRDIKAGEELFLTGKEVAIYYPRAEHMLIKYGDREIHYAVAVPEGEARYVLDRLNGKIDTVKGPTMLLPDPRTKVIVRRVLSKDQVTLWFPENREAQEFNDRLRSLQQANAGFVTDRSAERLEPYNPGLDNEDGFGTESPRRRSASQSIASEFATRSTTFTPPRSITLDEKYEGAVRIDVWPGYAIMVVDKLGNGRVVQGPKSTLLDFGESMLPMTLSTGRPKKDDRPIRTPYLQCRHNTVSDTVSVETADLFTADVELSYRVNFEGDDPKKWFEVDNYVKFLTDHLRSRLRHEIKQHGVEKFYRDAVSIIRDCILGITKEGKDKRPGCLFDENGMRVYDVEILNVRIEQSIHHLLVDAQREGVQGELSVVDAERELQFEKRRGIVNREILDEKSKTDVARHEERLKELERANAIKLREFEDEKTLIRMDLESDLGLQEKRKNLEESILALDKGRLSQNLEFKTAEVELAIKEVVDKINAIGPGFVSALQTFGDRSVSEKALQAMAPMALLGGGSVADVVNRMLKGTPFENILSFNPKDVATDDNEQYIPD